MTVTNIGPDIREMSSAAGEGMLKSLQPIVEVQRALGGLPRSLAPIMEDYKSGMSGLSRSLAPIMEDWATMESRLREVMKPFRENQLTLRPIFLVNDPNTSRIIANLKSGPFFKEGRSPELQVVVPRHDLIAPVGFVAAAPAQMKPRRGRPPGSSDGEFVSLGVDMVLRGEARTGQEAARMIVDILNGELMAVCGARHAQGSEAIDRLARKIRLILKSQH